MAIVEGLEIFRYLNAHTLRFLWIKKEEFRGKFDLFKHSHR